MALRPRRDGCASWAGTKKSGQFSRVESVQIYSLQAAPANEGNTAAVAAKALQVRTGVVTQAVRLGDGDGGGVGAGAVE